MSAFEIRAKANRETDVLIYGDIGSSWFDEESITAAKFVRDLQNIDAATINVRINSYGGVVADALAIFNSLQRHPATVHTFNDGVAISAASLILMAGETVTIAENAMTMIHGPSAMAAGNAADMRDTAAMLDKYAQAMAPSYAAKAGKSVDEMLALLTDGKDHWYTATEAKEAGFADAVSAPITINASFDLRRFQGVPAAAAAFTRSITMPEITPAAPTPAASQPTAVAPPAAATPPAAAPAPALAVVEAVGRTLEQNREIRAAFDPFMARTGIRDVYDSVMMDPAVTLEQSRAKLLTALGKDVTPANPQAHTPANEQDETKATIARIAAYANASRRPKAAAVK